MGSRLIAACDFRIAAQSGEYTFRPTSVALAGDKNFPFMTSVSLTLSGDSRSSTFEATVAIEAPFRVGVKMLESDVFAQNNDVSLRLYYPGTNLSTRQIKGQLINGPVGLSLTPTGLSGSIQVSPTTNQRIFSTLPRGVDIPQLIEVIARTLGYSDVRFEGEARNLINKRTSFIPTGRVNLPVVLGRILSESMCSKSEDEDGALVIAPIAPFGADLRTFVMRGGFKDPGFGTLVYPLESFGPEFTGAHFSDEVSNRTTVVADVDTDGNTTVERSSSDDTTDIATTGIDDSQPDASEGDPEIATDIMESPTPEDTRVAKERIRTSSLAANITNCSFELGVGAPDIVPQQIVEVVGCSKRFDGKYRIENVTHAWASGGITTSGVMIGVGK